MTNQRPAGIRSWLPHKAVALAVVTALCLAALAHSGLAQDPPPVVVKIEQDKPNVEAVVLAVDTSRVHAQPSFPGRMSYGLNVDGKRLTFGSGSATTTVKIDNQILQPAVGAQPLPPGPRGQKRIGVSSTFIHNNVHITQIMEVVPGKPGGKPQPGQKRLLDTLLIRYLIENKDTQAHSVGVRMFMDTYCWTNDGCLFASPTTHPNRILDGVELKDKNVPQYAQILQMPNLANPGWVAHFTFRIGRLEPPSRVVFTGLGANSDGWNVQVMQAMGDSAACFLWDPVMVPAGGKRELAFAQGQGIATSPESEAAVSLALGGSFEPGKRFTVMAYVDGPATGQSLTLDLPPGMELIEGERVQAVPAGNEGRSLVVWQGRVQRLGTFPVRVRSSTGVTYTSTVTVERPK
ncbi:MAG: hypothetical protein L0Z62_37130 [Gemmataceae bacterium]|nr:hypothetical protein [Gemmataceae bacterium]